MDRYVLISFRVLGRNILKLKILGLIMLEVWGWVVRGEGFYDKNRWNKIVDIYWGGYVVVYVMYVLREREKERDNIVDFEN